MGMGGGFGIVWYRPLISADPAIPQSAQAREVGEAFLLEEKSREAFVRTAKIPFVAIAMLEETAAFEVMLAHRVFQGVDGGGGHGERPTQPVPGEAEGVLVAMNVVVEEIGELVVPEGQAQRAPARFLVHQDLPALELRLVATRHVEQ